MASSRQRGITGWAIEFLISLILDLCASWCLFVVVWSTTTITTTTNPWQMHNLHTWHMATDTSREGARIVMQDSSIDQFTNPTAQTIADLIALVRT